MFGLTAKEKDIANQIKKLTKKPIPLSGKNIKTGEMVLFTYNAKNKGNPYDKTPMSLILRRDSKYTLGLNFNWLPPKRRKALMGYILRINKRNIKKGLPLEVSYQMLKKPVFKIGSPAIRLYLNNRISRKGVVVPHTLYEKIVDLRSEHFIGISAEKAWALATKKKFFGKF